LRQTPHAEPAYAEGFGVAGAHLSRRSEGEGGISNSESFCEQAPNAEESIPRFDVRCSAFAAATRSLAATDGIIKNRQLHQEHQHDSRDTAGLADAADKGARI
jgi:hypothetical protein